MNILALDTTGESLSLALTMRGRTESWFGTLPKQHSQHILIEIENLLQLCDAQLSDIDAIALTRGPGSFTGVRIGITIVQGLAYARNLPVYAYSTLKCLAQTALMQHPNAAPTDIWAAIDARMQAVYFGHFRIENGTLIQSEQTLLPESALANYLQDEGMRVGSGWDKYFAQASMQAYPGWFAGCLPLANSLLTLAAQDKAHGINGISALALTADYLRNQVAELPKKNAGERSC